jgi:mono/diheme cytochrome c family protein
MMKRLGLALAFSSSLASTAFAGVPDAPPSTAAFQAATRALFEETCSQCHNATDADGGLDVAEYASPESLSARRAGWESILGKLRSGEMPPSGVARRQDLIDDLVRFLDAELERADRNAKPDPGRVTLRRLNRSEYTNTIRDLLSVDFRADQSFPADDSGEGFDNIGDVLTVSPVLMEKYLAAAEHIAERPLGLAALPKPIQVEYRVELDTLRRVDASTVEATHHADHDADYELLIGLPGQRPVGSKPVTLGVWLDGELVHQTKVETTKSQLIVFNPYSEERARIFIPGGDHTLRLGFVRDDFIETLSPATYYERKVNKFIGTVNVVGPFASTHPSPSRQRLLVCDPNKSEPGAAAACVERILGTLARRAYRRPVSDAEIGQLKAFVDRARADGRSVEQGLALALQAVLVSPHFLFHVERDRAPSDPTAVHPISDIELASRLSYFVWSSMPDDELLNEASRGRLSQPGVLDAQLRRMLRDRRSIALAQNFAGQWLEIRNLDSIRPDPDKFPDWRPELRDAMKQETQLFFAAMLRDDRPLGEFLDARYTFLNEALAKHYGIPGVRGSEFRRVALSTPERGGVLSHASVLAVSSYPTRTSVSVRGKYVLQNLLGAAPPPPPPDVPSLDEGEVASSASLRQQMEAHRSNAVCASCHARMDPLGFGLENYDAIGRWRSEDGGQPVDASGVLPGGQSFDSPAELRQVLHGMLPDFSRCLTEKMLTYALGRGLEPYDKPTVRAITQKLTASKGGASKGGASKGGLQRLAREIVHSLPFRSRRAEGTLTAGTPPSSTAPASTEAAN